MRRPYRIIDLYCGAGGAARGYAQAGFEVVGVDLSKQPHYPFPFLRMDVFDLDPRFLASFDAIHASPPCQRFTALRTAKGAKGDKHPDLIAPTRRLLQKSGLPYVIENVEGAPLIDPIMLCGSMFTLGVLVGETWFQLQRHRLFECSFPVLPTPECSHVGPVIGVYGAHVRNRSAGHGGRGTRDFVGLDKPGLAHRAMGFVDRVTMAEISEAIPPAYTRYIGGQLIAHLREQAAAIPLPSLERMTANG